MDCLGIYTGDEITQGGYTLMAVPAIAVRVTRSKKRQQLLSRFKDAQQEVKVSLQRFKKPAVDECKKYVTGWSGDPKFVAGVFITPNGDMISLIVEPVGDWAKKWEWTSRGTKPHLITASKAPTLYFRSEYTPKTSPGNPPTYGGSGAVGGGWVRKVQVQHPGTTPRLFEEAIGKTLIKDFRREVENAVRRGLRKAG